MQIIQPHYHGIARTAQDYERRLELIRPVQVKRYVQDAVPLSTDRMDIVLRRGWVRFFDRYLRS